MITVLCRTEMGTFVIEHDKSSLAVQPCTAAGEVGHAYVTAMNVSKFDAASQVVIVREPLSGVPAPRSTRKVDVRLVEVSSAVPSAHPELPNGRVDVLIVYVVGPNTVAGERILNPVAGHAGGDGVGVGVTCARAPPGSHPATHASSSSARASQLP
jgi:hypothetical protein